MALLTRLLHSRPQKPESPILCAWNIPLTYDNSYKAEMPTSTRTQSFANEHFSGVIGSSFTTSDPNRISSDPHHILDAFYAMQLPTGPILAIADGSGGHFGDAQEDQTIAETAHHATQIAVKHLAQEKSADSLLKNLDQIIAQIQAELTPLCKGSRTTLAACRIFQSKKEHHVIGFNIGDNMMCTSDSNHQITTLLPSHCTEAGTALMPEPYKSFEVQKLDTTLPHGTTIFLCTDGIHDSLPHTETKKKYKNGLSYRERIFTPQKKTDIAKTVLTNVADLRATTSTTRLGDDLAMISAKLK